MKFKVSIILVIIISISLSIVFYTKEEVKTDYYDQQIEATLKTKEAFDAVKEKRLALNVLINEHLDPLKTGLIGDKQTITSNSITTTLGNLDAKRTSTNPNFAALIVKYLKDLDLKENDSVAVNFSSSFPALNIATIVALDVLNLNSVIQTSIGASTYGANIVEFTYLDMEKHLSEEGIIKRETDLISLGGERDVLYGMKQNDEEFINGLYNRYSNYEQVKETELKENVKYRYSYYQKKLDDIKAYINVGGNLVSHGAGLNVYPNGLVKLHTKPLTKRSGLIDYFANDHVKIINLLNILDLAKKHEMEINQFIPYNIGSGKQYYKIIYKVEIIIISLVIVYGALFYDFKRRSKIDIEEVFLNDK